jgi:lauroyl/myristoyl acyltransferase
MAAALYRVSGSVSFHLSALLPMSLHPGKRACAALRDFPDAPGGPYFARAILESRWRSRLLLTHLLGLSRTDLRRFLEERSVFEGAVPGAAMFDESRPVILAAPHYGAAPVGYLAALKHIGTRRPVNLFFDTSRSTPRINRLFECGGVDANQLLGGFSGVISAMRALDRKECLIMMPDAHDEHASTFAVPFFGRMLRVAAGTAFFALRSDAWVIPVFAAPLRRLGVRVTLGRPLDSRRFFSIDEAQSIFALTRAMFAAFDRELHRSPEHWHNWETFPRISTAVTPPGRLEEDAPMRLLRDKCSGSPQLLADVPELELLVR